MSYSRYQLVTRVESEMDEKNKLKKMFGVLVEQHSPMLVSYLAALTGSRSEAEDIAQETFIRAYHRFSRFDERGGGFPAWLRTIGKNMAMDRYRRSKRMTVLSASTLEGVEEVFAAADGFGSGDTWAERIVSLNECLEALPEKLGSVCRLHYFMDLRAKVIAEKLEIGLQTVLKRLQRARSALRECMDMKLGLEVTGANDGV